MSSRSAMFFAAMALAGAFLFQTHLASQTPSTATAKDPGVRVGAAGAGGPIAGLTAQQNEYFTAGKEDFDEEEDIADGLGPTMNLNGCQSCHSHPASGGSSPAMNPQVGFATLNGGSDALPSFLSLDGPIREARFVRNRDGTPDGGVHALFTISGRLGAEDCRIAQPDFATQVANHNVIFRIPTPVFGAGLIEQISDGAILASQAKTASTRSALGIRGRANFHVAGRTISGESNNNGNDGTIARFGWKAQNKSLLIFSGEAYNVEMGITNELFPTERDENAGCQYASAPNSITDTGATTPVGAMSSIEKFAFFMRFLAAPTPSLNTPGGATSIANGKALFTSVGCAACHTPAFATGKSPIAGLSNQQVALYSDLLLHDMGVGLSDGVSQGEAGPREFRTAPLWGLGQRVFFLHDGRTANLITAIKAHSSSGSEANTVVNRFLALAESQKQNLLNFLRSL